MRSRRAHALFIGLISLVPFALSSKRALAAESPAVLPPAAATTPPPAAPTPPPPPPEEVEFSDRLVLETGRYDYAPAGPASIRLQIHGEYQLRYRGQSDLPLQAPIRHPEATSLGQNNYVYHWLRFGARLQYRDKLQLVGQIDVPRGMVFGDTTQYVDKVRDNLAEAKWYEVHPRYLYLEYNSPIGIFRVGQQGSQWGTGILANDGDHPSFFGDYQRGSITERLLFATRPLGKESPLLLILAGDLVFEDNTAKLTDGDHAYQGVAAAVWRTKPAEVGIYGVVRHQGQDKQGVDALTPFTEQLTVGVLDVTGKFNAKIPAFKGFLYGQGEAAAIFGSTNFVRGNYGRATDPSSARDDETVRSFGATATLGIVHTSGEGRKAWGDWALELEGGYASGDADPTDGTTKRFTFDPNHRVGLVLFQQVMGWKTARAATIAQDPEVVNRAAPGLQLLPSKGGVFGAEYINPRFIYRPIPSIDLKTGVVIAQTSADFVDPYHFSGLGNAENYDGGDPHRHDLGAEIDVGVDGRIRLDQGTTLQLGAEGGALFPGHAFDDKLGNRLPNQYLANVKAGLQY